MNKLPNVTVLIAEAYGKSSLPENLLPKSKTEFKIHAANIILPRKYPKKALLLVFLVTFAKNTSKSDGKVTDLIYGIVCEYKFLALGRLLIIIFLISKSLAVNIKKKTTATTEKQNEISENLKSAVFPFKQNKITVKISGITIKIRIPSSKSVAFINFKSAKNASAAAQNEIETPKISNGLESGSKKAIKYKTIPTKKEIKKPKNVNLSAFFTGKPITALPKIKRVQSAAK